MGDRTRWLLILAAGAFLLAGTAVWAGDYHFGDTLVCSDCHVMHASQSHGYNSDGTGFSIPLVGAPHEYLLRQEVNDLCLACHNGAGSFAPDVLEANSGPSLVRQAGALNRDNLSPYFDETGHTLGTTDDAPGDTADGYTPGADGLECTNCHNPHGYGGSTDNPYRNLAPLGGFGPGSVSYAVGTNDLTKDVFERTAAVYTVANVDLNEPDPAGSGFADWCGFCHGDFHGAVGGPEIGGSVADGHFVRHPAGGVEIGGIGGGHSSAAVYIEGDDDAATPPDKLNYVKVMTNLDEWPVNGATWSPGGLANDLTPTCITCHKGHGNQNAFGLIYMANDGPLTEEGAIGTGASDYTYKSLCKQCHVQG